MNCLEGLALEVCSGSDQIYSHTEGYLSIHKRESKQNLHGALREFEASPSRVASSSNAERYSDPSNSAEDRCISSSAMLRPLPEC